MSRPSLGWSWSWFWLCWTLLVFISKEQEIFVLEIVCVGFKVFIWFVDIVVGREGKYLSLSLGFLRLETVGVAGHNWRTAGAWPRSWLNWTGFISVLSQGISKLGLERKKILLKLSLALSIKSKNTLTEFITNSWKSRHEIPIFQIFVLTI